MGLILVGTVFAAFGFIYPVAGTLLQEGIDVAVILNALCAWRERIEGSEDACASPPATIREVTATVRP